MITQEMEKAICKAYNIDLEKYIGLDMQYLGASETIIIFLLSKETGTFFYKTIFPKEL